MDFGTIFICIVLFIPIIIALLYTVIYPRDSALFGKRWQFNNKDLEPSESVIKYNRISGIIGLIIVAFILIGIIIKSL